MKETLKKHKTITLTLPLLIAGIIGAALLGIDRSPRLAAATFGNNLYVTRNTPFQAIMGTKDDPSKITFTKGNSSLSFNLPSREVTWTQEENRVIAREGEDRAYYYELIENGKDAVGLKEGILLKSPTDQNVFKFPLQLQNLRYQEKPGGTWHFYNLSGEELFFIPKPFMVDAAGERSDDVEIKINDNTLTITANKDWLTSPNRKFPIDIDPSLKLSVITLHSHPQAGDLWAVDFRTQGRATLQIIPDDQATIDHLDFISLTCGDREIDHQILENNIIHVDNWVCGEIATVTHLVNVAAPHILRFNFGGIEAYAYNSPGSTIYNFEGVTQETNDHFAYEKYGATTFTGPDDTGNAEATDTDYANISEDNSTYWTTEGATADAEYDAQLYKFYIDEDQALVSQIDFLWNGYGTPVSGGATTFYAYDYDGSSWTQLDQVDFTSSTDQDLTHSETLDPTKFVDTNGEVTLMTHAVYVGTITRYARPDSDIATGNWTASSGTDLYAMINDETVNDSTYARSADNPNNDTMEVGLSNVTDPNSSANHVVRVRERMQESGGGGPANTSVTITLKQGSTTIASNTYTHGNNDFSYYTRSFTLSTAEADSITDYSDLSIEIIAHKTGGARTPWIEVTWVEFDTGGEAGAGGGGLNTDYVELTVTSTKADGEVCEDDGECTSGNCVDGYCCNTTCTGGCERCDVLGSEGVCTTVSEGTNTGCTTCYYCDGTNTTCQLVPVNTDPYDDCTGCMDTCSEYTTCDGAGACQTGYCAAGTACTGSSCAPDSYCNTDWAFCSCLGAGCYDDGGEAYVCQAQCDGAGICDYAGNCAGSGLVRDSLRFDGFLSLNNLMFDFNLGAHFESCGDPISYEGQTYDTVQIGGQCWMSESLNAGTRIDGTSEQGTSCDNIDKYCYNDDEANCDIYGALYQWDQAMCGAASSDAVPSGVQGICPDGWHLPSRAELSTLENNVCGAADHEGAALAGNASLWTDGALTASGDFGCSGFNLLPAGYRDTVGSYGTLSDHANLWSSTESDSTGAWYRYVSYNNTDVYRSWYSKSVGFSVRCVKDWECGEPISYEGQTYDTVQIGDQCWLAQSLNVGTRIDGTSEQGTSCDNIDKYCYNDDEANCDIYGALYQWDQAMCGAASSDAVPSGVQGICPDGWHLPSDAELTTLENNVCGAAGHEGAALAGNASLWTDGALTGSGDFGCSGFDLLPAGSRLTVGSYNNISGSASLWSCTEGDSTNAWDRYVHYTNTGVRRYSRDKDRGFSVRCLRD